MHTDQKQLNCLVVDDEPLAQDVLVAHIARIPSLNLVQRSGNAMDAFGALHNNKIDLIFLDINMPVVSGLNFLRSLKDPPAVILTTAYTEYALEGYELDVVDYLVKPIPFDRFLKAVNKVITLLQARGGSVAPVVQEEPQIRPQINNISAGEKDYFFVKANGKLVKINYADIRYIEGMKDYLKIYCTNQSIVTHQTMKGMEEQLPSSLFLRVHKSYIVALNAIRSIDGNIIQLEGDKGEIPLGSSYRDAVLEIVAGEK